MKLIQLREIDSTHKLAERMIEKDQIGECCIIAERQTGGIGRCGREWISAEGNLFASVIKSLPLEAINFGISRYVARVSLAVACAVHKVLTKCLTENDSNLCLHWPNDIYYNGLKMSGILLSAVENMVVISVGVNIYRVSLDSTISLEEIPGSVSVSAKSLCNSILKEIEAWIHLKNINDFSSIKEYWLDHMVGIGQEASVRNGMEMQSGIIKGIDDSGRLILERHQKEILISYGDMFVGVRNGEL